METEMLVVSRSELDQLVRDLIAQSTEETALHNHRSLESIAASTDAFYLLFAGTIVFFMQAGFALLEAGSLRKRNVQNILFKNLLDPCFGALAFWSFGYGFAYGTYKQYGTNTFIGGQYFFLDTFSDASTASDFETEDSYHSFFFQFAFAATTATIVSGAVAERCKIEAYICYSIYVCMFVYPVVVHWVWSSEGFLSAFSGKPMNDIGCVDFAGSGVVHMCGAVAAFCGTYVLKPRAYRWLENGEDNPEFVAHNPVLFVLGTMILWFGWYGFNPGSTLGITASGYAHVAMKTATTTTLSAASAGITNCMLFKYKTKVWDLGETCNGVLSGLVGITAACSVVETWAAVLIGFISALVYKSGKYLLSKMRIDDPVNVIPVHGFCGAWGVIAVGLFASRKMMKTTYGLNEAGLFYSGEVKMLGLQLLEVVVIFAWTMGTSMPFFMLLDKLNVFRVSQDDEEIGLDRSEHGSRLNLNELHAKTTLVKSAAAVHPTEGLKIVEAIE